MTVGKRDAEHKESSSLSSQIEKTKTRAKSYVMDLRVQSPASNTFLGVDGLDSAPAIVRLAKVKGLDVIAITDFYSAEFVDRMVQAAKSSPLTVIPGVSLRCKVRTCSEVILSCLFPESVTAAEIEVFLRDIQVPTSARGDAEFVVGASLDQVLHALSKLQGIAIPSRLDKTPHRTSIIPELVETYGFRAFDLAYADSASYFKKKWPKTKFQFFTFSDANALAQIGSRNVKVKLHNPGFAGIREIAGREQL
jgi:PHP family Zn ribbon phosphoesterase